MEIALRRIPGKVNIERELFVYFCAATTVLLGVDKRLKSVVNNKSRSGSYFNNGMSCVSL